MDISGGVKNGLEDLRIIVGKQGDYCALIKTEMMAAGKKWCSWGCTGWSLYNKTR